MKGRLLIISALALLLTFGFASSGLQAKESISAYMGYSREVNEAIAKNVEENLGIEIKHISLSWGECWARVQTEKPNFNADMVISYGAHQAIVGKKQGIYECFQAPAWKDIDPVFKDSDGCWYALGTFSFILVGNKKKLAEKGWGMPMTWKRSSLTCNIHARGA